MAAFKGSTFKDRAEAAATAKKALLEGFKARTPADDPAFLARQAARSEVTKAREIRSAERSRQKAEDEARRKIEEEARLKFEAEEAERKAIETAARDEAIRNERKAARDARYAARKARRGK